MAKISLTEISRLGGHDSGEVASATAIDVMSKLCLGNPEYNEYLIKDYFQRANLAVVELPQHAFTTMVGGFIRNGFFYYQSIGDSRMYYFRKDKVYAQTKDDSVCQTAVELGTMKYDEIRTSKDRSKLLLVLGKDSNLKTMRKYKPIKMRMGDAFLLCSDGFWEHVLENEMTNALHEAHNAKEWLDKMLLIQYARSKNKSDNYTAICGMVESKDIFKRRLPLSPLL